MDRYCEIWYEFSKHTKLSLQLHPFPSFGGRNREETKKSVFYFQIIKLCCKAVLIVELLDRKSLRVAVNIPLTFR